MKRFVALLALALLASGCQISRIESRRTQAASAYQELSPDEQQLVDAGEIARGMSPDAVFIAWGNPSRMFSKETAKGEVVTWQYFGNTVVKRPYWQYRPERFGRGTFDHRMEHFSSGYLRAEVVFLNNEVIRWQVHPRPQWTRSMTLFPKRYAPLPWNYRWSQRHP